MWSGHADTGLTAGLAWVALVPPAGVADGVARVVVTVGYSVAPDIDHRSALPAKMWGPVSGGVARVVQDGLGHRGGTHEAVAPAVAGVAAAVLGAGVLGPVGVGVVWAWTVGLALVVASAYRVVPRPKRRRAAPVNGVLHILGACVYSWPGRLAVSVGAGYWAAAVADGVGWLGWAVALGIAAHLAGDACTKWGIPFTRWVEMKDGDGNLVRDDSGRVRFEKRTDFVGPRIFVTGSWAEASARRILQTVSVVLVVVIVWQYSSPETRHMFVAALAGVAGLVGQFFAALLDLVDAALAAGGGSSWIGLVG